MNATADSAAREVAVENNAHPTSDINDVVHQKARLGILSVLSETKKADFGYLKKVLQLTDGNLARHIEVLAAGNFVTVTKGYEGKRPRTWVTITQEGRCALDAELAAISRLLERLQPRPQILWADDPSQQQDS